MTITAISSRKIDPTRRIPPAVAVRIGPDEKVPPSTGTNQIAGFVEFRPLTSRRKRDIFAPNGSSFQKDTVTLVYTTHETVSF